MFLLPRNLLGPTRLSDAERRPVEQRAREEAEGRQVGAQSRFVECLHRLARPVQDLLGFLIAIRSALSNVWAHGAGSR